MISCSMNATRRLPGVPLKSPGKSPFRLTLPSGTSASLCAKKPVSFTQCKSKTLPARSSGESVCESRAHAATPGYSPLCRPPVTTSDGPGFAPRRNVNGSAYGVFSGARSPFVWFRLVFKSARHAGKFPKVPPFKLAFACFFCTKYSVFSIKSKDFYKVCHAGCMHRKAREKGVSFSLH